MPQVLEASDVSAVTDEWNLFSTDDIPEQWTRIDKSKHSDNTSVAEVNDYAFRIDEFWAKVCKMQNVVGDIKYKMLSKVVMAALALPHGNADVERGFSKNMKLVTCDKVALCPGTISACRLVKDTLDKNAGGRASSVVVTPALMASARAAHSKYKEYLENEKQKKAQEKAKTVAQQMKKLAEDKKKADDAKRKEQERKDAEMLAKEEASISVAEQEQRNLLSSAGSLLKEAEAKLAEAIKAGDVDKTAVAHGLLEIARKRTYDATDELGKLSEKRKRCLQKRKRHLPSSDSGDAKKARNRE